MLRVGLTGGIASGKSEVAARLAARGAVVIDADLAARQAVAPDSPGLTEVVACFGGEVLAPDGNLDRARLGEIVFADPGQRGRLNAIVHPRVAAIMAEQERAASPDAIVVHDVPLIAENSLAAAYDVVVVVDVPPRVQMDRLTSQRGLTAGQARARISAQAGREQRLAIAGIVVDNSGSLAELDNRAASLWAELRRRARDQAR